MNNPTARPPEDFRQMFAQFLSTELLTANPSTVTVLRKVNAFLVDHQVPMTQEHFEAATNSVRRGDSLIEFARAENKFVLESRGSGIVYDLAYLMHDGLWLLDSN